MRITGWQIDGFGSFHDTSVHDLPGGLVVVCGPNEAGKTTLAHFLKGMLFGFPDGRSSKLRHPPLRGGTLGGTLSLAGPDGTPLRVCRGEKQSSLQLLDATGAAMPKAALAELLGHASADLFDNVFAVDLRDLVELRALSDEQVRDRIYSAGVLGAGHTARAAIAALEKERDALLKPGGRGTSYRLHELRDALRHLAEELNEARRAAAHIPEQRQQILAARGRIKTLGGELARLQQHKELLANVLALWEPWQAARAALAEEATAAPLPELPAAFASRFDAALSSVADATGQFEEAGAQVVQCERDLREVEVDPLAVAAELATSALSAASGEEKERRAQLDGLQRALTEQDAAARDALARLGPGLDEAWLATQPVSVAAEAELRARAAALAEAADTVAAARRAHAGAQEALQRIAPAPLAPSADAPLPSTPELARRRVDDLLRLAAVLTQPPEAADRPTTPVGPRWLAVAGLAALAALVAGVVGLATGNTPLAVISLVLVAATVAACAWAARARPDIAAATTTASERSADIAPLLARLALTVAPPVSELGVLQHEAQAHEQLVIQLAHAQGDVGRTEEALRAAELEEETARTAWQAWLAGNGMPASVDPRAAGQYLTALAAARAACAARDRCAGDLHKLTAASAAFATDVQELAARVSLPADGDPLDLAQRLVDRGRAAVEAAAEAKRLATRLEDAREVLGKAQTRVADATLLRDELLTAAHAGTVEEAHAVVAAVEAHLARQATIDAFEHDLASRCGTRAGEARDVLAEEDPTGWQARAQAIDAELASTSDERDTCVGDLRALEDACDAELRSERIPALEQRQASLLADLQEATHRWQVLGLARELLDATLEQYRRERQPEVVQRASAHFAQITDQRYPSLLIDDGAVTALDRQGNRVDAAALSRGTADQLYLSLRFALAEALAATSPLPLLLDDVLANSDSARSPQLAKVIAAMAHTQQVFFFTCHERTVELLQDAEPGLHLEALPSTA